jgi:hypothetical protein
MRFPGRKKAFFFFRSSGGRLTVICLLTRPHSLRYTLKNKETNTELFVVVIQLMPTEQGKAEGAKSPEEELEAVHGKTEGKTENDDDLD